MANCMIHVYILQTLLIMGRTTFNCSETIKLQANERLRAIALIHALCTYKCTNALICKAYSPEYLLRKRGFISILNSLCNKLYVKMPPCLRIPVETWGEPRRPRHSFTQSPFLHFGKYLLM